MFQVFYKNPVTRRFIKTQIHMEALFARPYDLPQTEKNDRAKAGILAEEPQCNLIVVLRKGSTL